MKKYLLIFLLFIYCDQFNNPVVVIEDPYSYNDTCLIGVWEKHPPYSVFSTGIGWIFEFKKGGIFSEKYYKNGTLDTHYTKTGTWKNTNDGRIIIFFDKIEWTGEYDIVNMTMLYFIYSWKNGSTTYRQHNICKRKR